MIYNYVPDDGKEKDIPIRKGCPNINGCFCTGACQEIVGWEKPKRFPLCMEFDKDKTHESLMFIGGAKLK
jgi:hypothetical protein